MLSGSRVGRVEGADGLGLGFKVQGAFDFGADGRFLKRQRTASAKSFRFSVAKNFCQRFLRQPRLVSGPEQ